MECKAQALRKKFMLKETCICDIYFEYPVFSDGDKEKKAINKFYKGFAENAAEFAKKESESIQNEGFILFLRMHYSVEYVSQTEIKISLFISRRHGVRTVLKKSLSQTWDISTQKLIKA